MAACQTAPALNHSSAVPGALPSSSFLHLRLVDFPDHPDEASSTVTEKAKTIAGGCLAQARRGTTSGPKSCGLEVRN